MLAAVQNLIGEYDMLPRGSKVLCALSGGADSVCLLHLLYRLRPVLGIRLAAAHYNHGLRGEESLRDERFVEELVQQCCGPDRTVTPALPGVELAVGRGDVAAAARDTGRGVEETAREMRYDFLQQTAQRLGCTVIATAHNADDNAETMVMNLLRGTGLRGLGGIPPVRDGIVRPLLTTTRGEIEDYLRTQGLTWVEDSTNGDDRYFRNRVRHQVLPALRAAAPDCDRKLMAAAEKLRRDEAYLQRLADEALSGAEERGGQLRVPAAAVGELDDVLALRCARRLMTRVRGGDSRCTAAHLQAIVELCRGADPSGQADLPGGLKARREYDTLVLERAGSAPDPEERPLPMPGELSWGRWQIRCRREEYAGRPNGPWDFWLEGEIPALTVDRRRVGDELALPGRRSKRVKKWLIEEKIPAAQRDGLPVLRRGETVAAVGGLGPDRAAAAAGGTAWHIQITPALPEEDNKETISSAEAEKEDHPC